MTEENIYSKLTPSAKDAINELTEEFRKSLIERAFLIAEERETAEKEISLRDVLEAKQPAKSSPQKAEIFRFRKKRYAMLISFSGAIYAVAGIVIYMIQNKKFSIVNDLGLVIAIIGILITLLAYIYNQLLLNRYQTFTVIESKRANLEIDNFEIVKRWQIIEALARKLMTDNDKDESSSNSVGFLIRFLSHKVALNENEFLKIRELLQMRSRILHENYNPSNVERSNYISFANELINRLETAISHSNQKKQTLKIIKAVYGTEEKTLDATSVINQLVNNNRLEVIVNNELVGDPDYGKVKSLTITYEINGITQTKYFKEGDKAIIDK